jgi:hypothetical protein
MTAMRRIGTAALALLLAGWAAGAAVADCYYNGQSVPEGTQAGGLVCRDGQWVPED